MACRRLFVLVSTLALLATPALAAETRPVVELFTSQGCSSCPAADRVLGELARDGRVIALSVPVDYWDYLGWKDTLAQHAHSLRQRGYAGGRGDRQRVLPAEIIPVVDRQAHHDKRRIARKLAGELVGRRTRGTSLTGEQLNDRARLGRRDG